MNFLNWYRPVPQLAHQAALGVQAVLGYEQSGPVTREQYKAACRTLNLPYLLQAPPDDATLAAEAVDPLCIGWDQADEPNDEAPVTKTPAELLANYKKWKAAAPNKIVLLNFDGSQQEGWSHNADGTPYDYNAASAAADWIMFDLYVRNRMGPGPDIKATMGPVIDRFKGYAAGKPMGFWLETSNQNLSKQMNPQWAPLGCGPSAADIQAYFDIAASKGVQIIGLFEDIIGTNFEGFGGDEPAAIVNTIATNMAKLKTPLPNVKPGAVSPASGSSDPWDGAKIALTDGAVYTLTRNR